MDFLHGRWKILAGVLLAAIMALSLGFAALAQGGGEVTVQFVHGENGPLIGQGNLTLTAPDIGDNHDFKYWVVNGERHDDRTVTIDMTEGGTAKAVYNLTVKVCLKDSQGNPLEGADVEYADGSWKNFGTTGSDGCVSKGFGEDTTDLKVRLNYAGGSQTKTQNVSNDHVINFQTFAVTGRLEDSDGNGIADGAAEYAAGGWSGMGSTGSDGNTATKELLPGSYKFKMSYRGGSQQKTEMVSSNTTVVFQTVSVNARLEDSDDNGVSGGSAEYGAGSWYGLGSTGSDGNTPVNEMLPGTYDLRMHYRGKSVSHDNVSISGTDHTEVFQTSTVCLNYDGDIKYSAGKWWGFNQPCMELLPGAYDFKFGDSEKTIAVSGAQTGGCVTIVRLQGASEGAYAKIEDLDGEFKDGEVLISECSDTIYARGFDPSGKFRGGRVRHLVDGSDLVIPYSTFEVKLQGAQEGAFARIEEMEGNLSDGSAITLPKSDTIYARGFDPSGKFRGGRVRHLVDGSDLVIPYCTVSFEWQGFPDDLSVRTVVEKLGDVPDGGSVNLPKGETIYFRGYMGDARTGRHRELIDCTWDTWTWEFSAGHN